MKCLLCEKEMTAGILVLAKDRSFILLGSIAPTDVESCKKQEKEFITLGWQKQSICEACKNAL